VEVDRYTHIFLVNVKQHHDRFQTGVRFMSKTRNNLSQYDELGPLTILKKHKCKSWLYIFLMDTSMDANKMRRC